MTAPATERLATLAREWRVAIDRVHDSPTSLIAFGRRAGERVVLKVARAPGDEWHAGGVTAAFDGRGVVRVLAHAPGAVLIEQLMPGTPLVELVRAGRDQQAVSVLTQVIQAMQQVVPSVAGVVSVSTWRRGFDRYLASGDRQIDHALVLDARDRYERLCQTQRGPRLLHGDLQHYNVLLDEKRGWTAIDPKGVVGEVEYELGAALRNPHGTPELFAQPAAVLERVQGYARELDIDVARTIEWAYAQALLSAIWAIEDGATLGNNASSFQLAAAARQLLGP